MRWWTVDEDAAEETEGEEEGSKRKKVWKKGLLGRMAAQTGDGVESEGEGQEGSEQSEEDAALATLRLSRGRRKGGG